MIEISLWKILLVVMIALIVLGPTQFSKAATTLGRLLAHFRKIVGELQKELSKAPENLTKEQQESKKIK